MDKIQAKVLLSPFTTLKIGGPADYFAKAESVAELKEFYLWAKDKNLPVLILGGGSNILISDEGFRGLVIKPLFLDLVFQGNDVYAGAGLSLAKLVMESVNRNLSGLEWAIGVPGLVGGAVCGNASCFGGKISDNIESVKILNLDDLSVSEIKNSECGYGYKESIFKNNTDLIILGASFFLKSDSKEEIALFMKEIIKKRSEAQPTGEKSAGSFFKNIEWKRPDIKKDFLLKKFPELKQFSEMPTISAKFLIESLGLKGKKMGGAAVSEKHANFLINTENATAEQMMMLVGLIRNKVFSHYGFVLEEEVQLVGFE